MSLQGKKAATEARIANLSKNIERRQADVREFIENTLSKVLPGWPYPGGWDKWIMKRLEGIEAAHKTLLNEYKEKEEIEQEIVKEAKEKDDRIKAEAEAALRAQEQRDEAARIAEENCIAAEQAAQQHADAIAAQIAEENARKAAADAERAAKVAELNAILNEVVQDTRRNRHNKIIALEGLYRLHEITTAEYLSKKRAFIDQKVAFS